MLVKTALILEIVCKIQDMVLYETRLTERYLVEALDWCLPPLFRLFGSKASLYYEINEDVSFSFWDVNKISFMDYLQAGKTINSD